MPGELLMKTLIAAVVVLASIAAFGGNSAESARPQAVKPDFSPWVRDGAIAQSNCVCTGRGRDQCIGTAQCQAMGGPGGGSC
jgi:hypothetical protein